MEEIFDKDEMAPDDNPGDAIVPTEAGESVGGLVTSDNITMMIDSDFALPDATAPLTDAEPVVESCTEPVAEEDSSTVVESVTEPTLESDSLSVEEPVTEPTLELDSSALGEPVSDSCVTVEPVAESDPGDFVSHESGAAYEPGVPSYTEPEISDTPEETDTDTPSIYVEPGLDTTEDAMLPSELGEAESDPNPTPVFNKRAENKRKSKQSKTDLELVNLRFYEEIRRLEMDKLSDDMSFTARIAAGKSRRARRRIKRDLRAYERRLSLAEKHEELNNERYYRLLLLDPAKVRIKGGADRTELYEIRERISALLDKRHELNLALIELYAPGGNGAKRDGRFRAELNARKRAYKRQIPLFKECEKANIELVYKREIYPLMDERTLLYGELARLDYILKKEKPKGERRREVKKERREVKRSLRKNKKKLGKLEDRAFKNAVEDKEKKRSYIGIFVFLGIVAVLVALFFIFRENISAWFNDTLTPFLNEIISGFFGKTGGGATPTE